MHGVSLTSFLLLAVFNDAGCVDEGDPLQEFMGHLDANQSLQEALTEPLQRGKGPRTVRCHDNAFYGSKLLAVHNNRVLRGGGLSAWCGGEEGFISLYLQGRWLRTGFCLC